MAEPGADVDAELAWELLEPAERSARGRQLLDESGSFSIRWSPLRPDGEHMRSHVQANIIYLDPAVTDRGALKWEFLSRLAYLSVRRRQVETDRFIRSMPVDEYVDRKISEKARHQAAAGIIGLQSDDREITRFLDLTGEERDHARHREWNTLELKLAFGYQNTYQTTRFERTDLSHQEVYRRQYERLLPTAPDVRLGPDSYPVYRLESRRVDAARHRIAPEQPATRPNTYTDSRSGGRHYWQTASLSRGRR
jgi:hypothetical protein